MENYRLNIEEQIKIKTICDFLFLDRFQDSATFPRFEKCLQPLFNNTNISMLKVFKEICGHKKKYITYKRFVKAYLNNINSKDSNDSTIFFHKLFNTILKKDKVFTQKENKIVCSFSNKKTCKNRDCISMVQILSDKEGKINGINLEYDGNFQSKMYQNTENSFFLKLELNLGVIDNRENIEENIKEFTFINQGDYRDSITHIFGTISEEKGYITYIGFKCISGKTVFVGFPEGEGFLFGNFGNKFHDLRIQMTKDGISFLNPGFKKNLRKNYFLGKISENLSELNINEDEIIRDEEKLVNLNDENEIEKYITIEDDSQLHETPKDDYFGNDYKEVVDQHPRNWILNLYKSKEKEEKKDSLNLSQALNLYEKETEITKKRETIIKKNKNLSYNNIYEKKDNQSSYEFWIDEFQNNMNILGQLDLKEKNFEFIPNPFYYDTHTNEKIESNINDTKNYKVNIDSKEPKNEKEIPVNTGTYLHKTKIYIPTSKDHNFTSSNENKRFGTQIIWNGRINDDTRTSIFFNKNNYNKLKYNLGFNIKDDIFEKKGEYNINIPFSRKYGTEIINRNTQINNKNQTKVKMKNLKGETVILGEDKDIDDKERLKLSQEKWKHFRKGVEKLNGVYLLQTIGSIIKAKLIIEKKIDCSIEEKNKLFKLMEENEKIINFLSKFAPVYEEEYENVLIPNDHPEEITSLANLQNVLDNIKELLNKNLKKEDRIKLEKLRDLYLQQKNILIENETKKVKEKIFKNIFKKYIIEEREKRVKAKEEEKKKFEKELREKKEEEKKESRKKQNKSRQSIVARKKPSRLYHNQKIPEIFDSWNDDMFLPNKNSLCPYNENNEWIFFTNLLKNDIEDWETYDWCRIDELLEDYNIFEEGAKLDDIIQGNISDCYFLSAMGSLCSCDGFFEKIFLNNEKSDNHIYGVYLFLNGKWKLVLVDDYFPYSNLDYISKEFSFSRSIQNEIWVSLIEKAWAKVNGCYARIGCGGFSYEAFDVLTEAYTENIDIKEFLKENKEIKEELWDKIDNSFKRNYVLTAGTLETSEVDDIGLKGGHAYSLVKTYKVDTEFGEERLIKLRNPFREEEFHGDWSNNSNLWTDELKEKCEFNKEEGEEDDGIFYMSFDDFIKYFESIDIAKVEVGYQTTYCKIKKSEATKCQIIKLKVNEDNPRTYIQLYQKNPRILRKDGTYYPKTVKGFIILFDEKFQYIKSVYGYDMHMAIEVDLKPGTYYIFCDVNYRNETKDFKNYGYTVSFYSKNLIKEFENITEKMDIIKTLEVCMNNYCKKNIEPIKDESGINIYDTNKNENELPFRVLCLENISKNNLKVKLNIKYEEKKCFIIYSDKIGTEFDSTIVKEIISGTSTTIIIMGYSTIIKYELDYKILPSSDESSYESIHSVFNCKRKEFDDKGKLFSYELKIDDGRGYIIGLENVSNDEINLRLKLVGIIDIDPEYQGKDNITFKILPKFKKVFNLRINPDENQPNFNFEEIK